MRSSVKSKAAAAHRGYLTARHWKDIRLAARLAKREGITLITHGVTTDGSTARGNENQPEPHNKSTATTARGGRGLQSKETIGSACEHPSAKQQHEKQPPKQQRASERSLRRMHDFQQTIACGARWEPLVKKLLRKERAISRAQVWTGHLQRRLALCEKMRAFLGRVLRHASNTAHPAPLLVRDRAEHDLAVRDTDARRQACAKLRHMVFEYDFHVTRLETRRTRRACSSANARANLRDLFMNYMDAWNVEAALAGLEPIKPSPRSSDCHRTPPDPPPEQRGTKRGAKKPTRKAAARGGQR